MKRATAGLGFAAAAALAPASQPSSGDAVGHHEAAAPAPATASYTLMTVNDRNVPATITHQNVTLEIRSGAFTIEPDGQCASRLVFVPPSGQEITRVVRATYTQEGSTLRMSWERAGVTRGQLAGGVFTMNNEGMLLIYAADRSMNDASAGSVEVQGWPCRGNPELDGKGRLKEGTLARPHVLGRSVLPEGTRMKFADGELRSCTLGAAARVAGFTLPEGTELRIRQGRPTEALLAANTTVRRLPLPAKTRIFFASPWTPQDAGTWRCWLPQPQEIQGHLCTRSNDGVGQIFYPNGKLRAIWLDRFEEIEGVPCGKDGALPFKTRFFGTDRMVWFFESGRLQQAMVTRDCVVQGRACKPGDIVRFNADGTLDASGQTLGASSRGPRWPK